MSEYSKDAANSGLKNQLKMIIIYMKIKTKFRSMLLQPTLSGSKNNCQFISNPINTHILWEEK